MALGQEKPDQNNNTEETTLAKAIWFSQNKLRLTAALSAGKHKTLPMSNEVSMTFNNLSTERESLINLGA